MQILQLSLADLLLGYRIAQHGQNEDDDEGDVGRTCRPASCTKYAIRNEKGQKRQYDYPPGHRAILFRGHSLALARVEQVEVAYGRSNHVKQQQRCRVQV